MKLNLKDQSSAREKQQSTVKSKCVINHAKAGFILPLFPAVFEENISVFNVVLLGTVKLVISKFK